MARQQTSRSARDLEAAQQIGRMAEALDRFAQDRKEMLERMAQDRQEFLAMAGKLGANFDAMNGLLNEMRSAFAGMTRRMETLEKDGDRCEHLEKRVDGHDTEINGLGSRIQSFEDWRTNRRRTMAYIASIISVLVSSAATVITEFALHGFKLH